MYFSLTSSRIQYTHTYVRPAVWCHFKLLVTPLMQFVFKANSMLFKVRLNELKGDHASESELARQFAVFCLTRSVQGSYLHFNPFCTGKLAAFCSVCLFICCVMLTRLICFVIFALHLPLNDLRFSRVAVEVVCTWF